MLEIVILYFLGRGINRKASAKGWPGWPFVLMLICLYYGGALTLAIIAVIASGGMNGNADQMTAILGALVGAVLGAIASYIIVGLLPDRSEPDDDYDRPRRRAIRERDEDDYEDERDLPKARRDDDPDDGFRRRY